MLFEAQGSCTVKAVMCSAETGLTEHDGHCYCAEDQALEEGLHRQNLAAAIFSVKSSLKRSIEVYIRDPWI